MPKIISSNKSHTKIISMNEKGFTNIEYNVGDKNFLFDSFCEKPAYVPIIKDKTDPNYNNFVKLSMYYPLGDKIQGYSLYDTLCGNVIPAKGTYDEQSDNTEYLEIRNGDYRKALSLHDQDSLNGYYIRATNVPLEKSHKVSSKFYSTGIYISGANAKYGKLLNFTYDGIAPGTGDTSINLLYDETPVPTSQNSNFTITKSVFNTDSYTFDRANNTVNTEIKFSNISVPNDNIDWYTFSFYARVYKEETIQASGSLKETVKCVDSNASLSVSFSEQNGQSESFIQSIQNMTFNNVNSDWKLVRFFINGSLIKGKTINIYIFAGSSDTKNILKFCGFMLNKGKYVITYDNRFHKSSSVDYRQGLKYPLLIDFLNTSGTTGKIPSDSSWTVCYDRYVNAASDCSELNSLDSLGNGIKLEAATGVTEQWEKVFLIYDSSLHKIKYRSYSDGNTEYSREIEVTNLNFNSSAPDEPELKYNLILGGYEDSETINVNGFCRYRDLMIFPYVLSDTDIRKMADTCLSVSFDTMKYDESLDEEETTKYELKKNIASLRSSSFFETSNI